MFHTGTILRTFFFLTLLSATLIGCGGGGDDGGSTPTQTQTLQLSGSVQKGPLILGSNVTINDLNTNLSSNGKSYSAVTTDNLGSFSTSIVTGNSLVDINTSGYFFDEITGEFSTGLLTLRAISKVSKSSPVKVNILTHLAKSRIETLVNNNVSFDVATSQAQQEVLDAFGFTQSVLTAAGIDSATITSFDKMDLSQSGDSNGILLAISSICLQMAHTRASSISLVPAELANLLAEISADIANNGILDSTAIATEQNLANLALDYLQIIDNLQLHYSSQGTTITAPTFEKFIDTDGDGDINAIDTDDDADGILDINDTNLYNIAPTITSFVTASATITAGSSVNLTAVFANGTGSIDNSVGVVTSGVAASVTPASTTTYTLTVTSSNGTAVTSVTSAVTVTVVPASTITSFVTASATITAGSSVNLTAVFANGTGSIDNSVGVVTSGVAKSVAPASTTTYTLTVTNSNSTSVTSTVTVTVVPAPTITSFVTSATTIFVGSSVNLTAVFANGTGSISDSVGAVDSNVAKLVAPVSTTTYTLTVTHALGTTVTSTVTVTVIPLVVTVSTVDVKTVQFNWNAITSATSYKLYVNPDGASGFTLQTDNISGASTELTLPVHFTDWVNATYMVEAYDSTTLLVSSTAISITSEMLNTIGYVKASNPTASDIFGDSVSLSSDGNTLAVGSRYEDGSAAGINGADNDSRSSAGAVYVFTRSGSTWSQQAYVKSSNPSGGELFGRSVSLSSDGNTLAVGALGAGGAVYVFTRSGSIWSQQAYVKASDVNDNFDVNENFGESVSLSSDGNTLAVGSPSEDGSSAGINGTQDTLLYNAGAVYVFTRSGSTWTQQAYVKASNPSERDNFGNSVSLSSDGNTLAVGAFSEGGSNAGINSTDNDSFYRAGAVYVFTRSGSTWTQQAYVKASNPSERDIFGNSVSLSSDGNTLAVGAYGEGGSTAGINGADNDSFPNAGAVYVFTRSGSTWSQQAYVKSSNPVADDYFGLSVSLSSDGNTLAVGSMYEDGSSAGINGSDDDLMVWAGAVYVFTRSGSTWTQQAYVKASNPTASDNFGVSVSLSSDGNTLAVGAYYEDGSSTGINGSQNNSLTNAGAVYIY